MVKFLPGQKVLCRSTMRRSGDEFIIGGEDFIRGIFVRTKKVRQPNWIETRALVEFSDGERIWYSVSLGDIVPVQKNKNERAFDRLWAKLIKISGNPQDVDGKSVKAMKASIERLGGVSPEMRKRLLDKIEYKQAAWALQG